MAKKSTITGEFIITQEDDGKIQVFQIFDKASPVLKKICQDNGIEYPASANTQQLGRIIVKALGDGQEATVGEYWIHRRPDVNKTGNRPIEISRDYGHGNVTAALRDIAEKVGFKYNENWNTQQLGAKLIDFIETNN